MTGYASKKAGAEDKFNTEWVDLRDRVIEQIIKDVRDGDVTAIEELLVYCTDEAMRRYLPEGDCNE